MERFSADFGMPLYYKEDKQLIGPVTFHNLPDGDFCIDDTEAKAVPFKKQYPKYLKVVKNSAC
jgi:hypothetical protein